MLHRVAARHGLLVFVPPEGLDAHRWELSTDPFDAALAKAQAKRQLAARRSAPSKKPSSVNTTLCGVRFVAKSARAPSARAYPAHDAGRRTLADPHSAR